MAESIREMLTKAYTDSLVKTGKTPMDAEREATAQAKELLGSDLNLRGQARLLLNTLCDTRYETPFVEALKSDGIEYDIDQYVQAIQSDLQAQLSTRPEMTDPANAELFDEAQIIGPDGKVITVQRIIIGATCVYMDENRQIIEMEDILGDDHTFSIDPKKIIGSIEHRQSQMVTDNLSKGQDGNGPKGPNMEDGRGL